MAGRLGVKYAAIVLLVVGLLLPACSNSKAVVEYLDQVETISGEWDDTYTLALSTSRIARRSTQVSSKGGKT